MKKKYYLVYKITRISTKQIYIGIHETYNPNDSYMGSGKRIKAAIKKHGLVDFNREILFCYDTEIEMVAKEKELVTEEFCKRDDVYNLAPGGFSGGWKYINMNGLSIKINEQKRRTPELSKEWVRKNTPMAGRICVQKRLSRGLTPYGTIPGDAWRGRKHTDETKTKIGRANSIRQVGKFNSQFGTIWLTDGEKTIKVPHDYPIPEGWYRGRK